MKTVWINIFLGAVMLWMCWIPLEAQLTDGSNLIIDMMLASPDDDPEPYVIEYIQGKEKVRVKKIRVIGAPDTPDVFYTAYQTLSAAGQGPCRNLWLVRISIADDMAQGSARVLTCEQAMRQGLLSTGQKRAVIQYSPSYWQIK